jgi:hypothetical protein
MDVVEHVSEALDKDCCEEWAAMDICMRRGGKAADTRLTSRWYGDCNLFPWQINKQQGSYNTA